MKKITTSFKGLKRAESIVIRESPQIITKAVLQKVPHNSEKVDITLKISRYNKKGTSIDYVKPKLEITLTNDELDNLIPYINDNYKPLSKEESKYITVDNNNAEITGQVKGYVL